MLQDVGRGGGLYSNLAFHSSTLRVLVNALPAFPGHIPPLPGLVMHFRHQCLKRAPADLAQIPINVRHKLLAIADAIDGNVRPPQIAVRFPEAAIADKGRFGCHTYLKRPRS
jgi:hypothetical protein